MKRTRIERLKKRALNRTVITEIEKDGGNRFYVGYVILRYGNPFSNFSAYTECINAKKINKFRREAEYYYIMDYIERLRIKRANKNIDKLNK